jgi:hypothetical protein
VFEERMNFGAWWDWWKDGILSPQCRKTRLMRMKTKNFDSSILSIHHGCFFKINRESWSFNNATIGMK